MKRGPHVAPSADVVLEDILDQEVVLEFEGLRYRELTMGEFLDYADRIKHGEELPVFVVKINDRWCRPV